jgi:hypothetical protein
MNNINGSIMQLSLNERGESRNVYGSRNIYTNVAVDFHTYNFQNYKLTLSRNTDKIIPEYLILNLYDNNTTLETLLNYSRNIYINFQIGTQTLLNIPLSILWNLKEPEICDNKLYLQIPFEIFFGDIHIVGLQFREVTFNIVNHMNLSNYVINYSLLCKTYIGDSQYRRNNLDTSNCCIQQISSLDVKVSLDNPENVSNEFRIKTNLFPGFSKGFFIESGNINDLNNMKFYINGETRIDYNRFMVRNKCQRINNNMIFFPFNPDISYNERTFNSFVGSVNLSEITQSSLKLIFDTPRASVKIYSMNMSDYTQRRSEIITSQNIINTHLVEDFTRHSLLQIDIIDRIEINQIVNNIRVNTIFENNVNTIQYNQNYFGMTGSEITYSSINTSIDDSIDDLIVDNSFRRMIPEERIICGISLDEICIEQKYMSCINCSNNFEEQSIRRWLTDRRTCPCCREFWRDFNIYINASNEQT